MAPHPDPLTPGADAANADTGGGSADERFVAEQVAWLRGHEPILGHLIAAIDFKRAMVDRFGVQRALGAVRPHLGVPGLDILRRRTVVSQVSLARNQEVFREVWRGGEPFDVALANVVGDGDHSRQSSVSRSGYLTRFDNALVRGRSAIVLVGNTAVVDFENGELDAFPDSALLDPGVLHVDAPRTYWTMEPTGECMEVDEAFMLSGSHTNDFGHWLTEYLPKLATALMAGLPAMPILVDQRIPRTHRHSLDWLLPGWPVQVIPHLAPVRVKHLWCTSNPMYRGYYPQDWTRAWETMLTFGTSFSRQIQVIKSLGAAALSEPTDAPRVYLARKPTKKKLLVNHAEIEALVASHGYRVVHPEELDFREQVRLVHHASRIIAPDGSAGLLAYFAQAGARVLFLNHEHTDPLVDLQGIFDGLGVDFSVVTGPFAGTPQDEPFWNDYRIDPQRLDRFLRQWSADAPPAVSKPRVTASGPRPLRVESLQAGSAFASPSARGKVRRVDFGRSALPIEMVRVADVRYVPSALETGQSVQVIDDGCMPVEAVFDDFTPGFVREKLLKKGLEEISGFEQSPCEGDVCILGNVFSRNFTHWHEELMKLVVLEQAGCDCTYVVSELPAFAAELLRLLGVPPHRMAEVRRPTQFRSAIYTTAISYRNVAAFPGVLLRLRQRLLAAAAPPRTDIGPRLWLDRGKQTRLGRKLVNGDEVQALLDRFGFERIDMGALPVAEQMGIARDSRIIGGLHGSQFVHSQLMAPRSWVVECFSPLYLNPTYTEIYRVLRHRYAQLSGTNTPVFPYAHGGDVLVDCQQLALALSTATEAT